MTVSSIPKASALTDWRKSSYSGPDNGSCVEVADTIPASALAGWRKSSYSNPDGGSCVEVADGVPGLVPVRDSKNPDGPAITIPAPAWTSFISALTGDDLNA
ncbi:DUF397 domain-containing protein [Streptomyces sp. GMY02]|uniref:DUF397 domain-containing protein n=1 Tax=Streptomyces sp. GMY02 TaxID=1333528 RepID=UPI001C2C64AD|nr:DUF397 domain-containing protein [Streptomyces sp. GMY02]QXE35019.1 DUF397 domain-containing protein [Streptomyces sp. GMY02]